VDVLCRATALFPDRYEIDQHGTRLFGVTSGASYALFDRIAIKIDDVSIARRKISGVPVESVRVEQLDRPRPRRLARAERPMGVHGSAGTKGRDPQQRRAKRKAKETRRDERKDQKRRGSGPAARKKRRR
jgi:hypothetical protein